MTSDLLT